MAINLENIAHLSRDKQEEIIRIIEEFEKRQRILGFQKCFTQDGTLNDRKFWEKHWDWMQMGATAIQRYFSAANRIGKTNTGACEAICHASGVYYEGWKGKQFYRPTIGWVVAPTPDSLRQGAQMALLGDIDNYGTGAIPKEFIIDKPKTKHGSNDICSVVRIRHVPTGGVSLIYFKTDKQDTESFASAAVDWVWIDEQCKWKTYTECLTRVLSTKGILFMTGTPEKGLNKVTLNFMPSGRLPKTKNRCGWVGKEDDSKWVTVAGWKDVFHLDEKYKRAMLATYLPHEIKAKTEGLPSMAAGLVYPLDEDEYTENALIEIPPSWPRVFSFDPSYRHAGALWGAFDPLNKVLHIYEEYKATNTNPIIHVSYIKSRGDWIPGVFDPAISRTLNHDTGKYLQQTYEKLGLNIVLAKNDMESGIRDVFIDLQLGRIKISRQGCPLLLDEMRVYSYGKDGKPAREQEDDLCDCLKYMRATGIHIMRTRPDEDDDEKFEFERRKMYQFRDELTGY